MLRIPLPSAAHSGAYAGLRGAGSESLGRARGVAEAWGDLRVA